MVLSVITFYQMALLMILAESAKDSHAFLQADLRGDTLEFRLSPAWNQSGFDAVIDNCLFSMVFSGLTFMVGLGLIIAGVTLLIVSRTTR